MALKIFITVSFPVFYALISCWYFGVFYHEIGHYIFIRIWERVMKYKRSEIGIYIFSTAPAVTVSDFYIKLANDKRTEQAKTATRMNALAGLIFMLLNGFLYSLIWTIPFFIMFKETYLDFVIPIPGVGSFIVNAFFAFLFFFGKKGSKESDWYFFRNPEKFLKYILEVEDE